MSEQLMTPTQSDTQPVIKETPLTTTQVVVTPPPPVASNTLIQQRDRLSPEQRWYRQNIGNRPFVVTINQSFLASHTLLLRDQEDFSTGALPVLSDTADAVVTMHLVPNKRSLPKLASCFRIYAPSYCKEKNLVRYGDSCRFIKDGSHMPYVNAKGPVFDYVANNINFRCFMYMDSEMEAAARNMDAGHELANPFIPVTSTKLLSSGPIVTDTLLGFTGTDLPLSWTPLNEPGSLASEALNADLLELLKLRAKPPSWLLSPGGKITEIHEDLEESLVCVLFDDKTSVEVPKFAKMSSLVAIGNEIAVGMPVATIDAGLVAPTWDNLNALASSKEISRMLTAIFRRSQLDYHGLRFVPHKYVSVEIASRNKQVIRDLRSLVDPSKQNADLGRVYHDPRSPSNVMGRDPASTPISVWNLNGAPSPDNLKYSGNGYEIDFYSVEPKWRNYSALS